MCLLALVGNLCKFRNSPEFIRQLSRKSFSIRKDKAPLPTDGSMSNPSPPSPAKPETMTHYFTVA